MCPLGGVAGQGGHGLQHRNADALQLGLALGGVEDQGGVDEHVGQAGAVGGVRHLKEQVFSLARAVEGVSTQATLGQRGNQAVQPGGVVGGEDGVVDGNCHIFSSYITFINLG